MNRARRFVAEHIHVIFVTLALTLVMTFPTIEYVFDTSVFWLPSGKSSDVFVEIWDVFYGGRVLSGQADRFYTNLLFYPDGVSLARHPINFPYVIVMNLLNAFMPISNAFSLAYLLIIASCVFSAYVYLHYLFRDKWIALLGAIIFGLSPHVVGHPNHPNNALVATLPLAVYSFHRGVDEKRRGFIIVAGLLTGLTSIINIYAYICLLMTLALGTCAMAFRRRHDRGFWQIIGLLLLTSAIASAWRITPMVLNTQSLDEALEWHAASERNNDLISLFVNHRHPASGPILESALRPDLANGKVFSPTSYLGYLPLLLTAVGLIAPRTRRQALPWLALGLIFLILRLGPALTVNGTEYPHIVLPKHLLNQLVPVVFKAFGETDNFMIGVLLPLAVTSCYGAAALLRTTQNSKTSGFIVLLIVVVAGEYYMPVEENRFGYERLAFLDWLADEDDTGEIRLIHLPMGRGNSKRYDLYQALSGYPQVEGAISRTPPEAFAYIEGNQLLNSWRQQQPVSCESLGREAYLSELSRLENDGFSHVVFHRLIPTAGAIASSLRGVKASYDDPFVAILRLDDLRDACSPA